MTKKIQYFLFDTETGGKDADKHSLLSFYGLMLNKNLSTTDRIDLTVKPDDGVYRVRAEGLKTNKIDLVEHDKTASTYSEATQLFEHFTIKSRGFNESSKIIPVGWNVRFDINFIQKNIMPIEVWEKYYSRDTIELKTLVHFLVLSGKLKIKKYSSEMHLFEIVEELKINIEGKQYHNACHDVEIEFALFKTLIELNKNQQQTK